MPGDQGPDVRGEGHRGGQALVSREHRDVAVAGSPEVVPFEAAWIVPARLGQEALEELLGQRDLPSRPGLLGQPHLRVIHEPAG